MLRNISVASRLTNCQPWARGSKRLFSSNSDPGHKRGRVSKLLLASSAIAALTVATQDKDKVSRSIGNLTQNNESVQKLISFLYEKSDSLKQLSKMWNASNPGPSNQFQGEKAPQSAILSPVTKNALYLTLSLTSSADLERCASRVAQFASGKQSIIGGDASSIAVGFAPRMWDTVQSKVPGGMPPEPFEYHTRRGKRGSLPATGGDIFVHIKGQSESQCLVIAQSLLDEFPKNTLSSIYCIKGFAFNPDEATNGSGNGCHAVSTKDIMTRCDINAVNPDNIAAKENAALVATTGGSYLLTQHWVHNKAGYESLPPEEQERVVGKHRNGDQAKSYLGNLDLNEEPGKLPFAIKAGMPVDSHVARVIGADVHGNKLSVVRQSLPCGSLGSNLRPEDRFGLYFLAYSKDPLVFWYMLDRMVGAKIRDGYTEDRLQQRSWLGSMLGWVTSPVTYWFRAKSQPDSLSSSSSAGTADRLMDFSRCIQGQCYYVPSLAQLEAICGPAQQQH